MIFHDVKSLLRLEKTMNVTKITKKKKKNFFRKNIVLNFNVVFKNYYYRLNKQITILIKRKKKK